MRSPFVPKGVIFFPLPAEGGKPDTCTLVFPLPQEGGSRGMAFGECAARLHYPASQTALHDDGGQGMTDRATLKRRASGLRSNQTPAERALWSRLRMRQVSGVRFLRQYAVGDFIIDFYAPSIRLAVELDGGQHYEPASIKYDAARSGWLVSQGIVVLRYTNLDVAQRLDDVLADIERAVAGLRRHPPAPAARPPSFRSG